MEQLSDTYSYIPAFLDLDIASSFLSLLRDNTSWGRFAFSPNSRLVSQWTSENKGEVDLIMNGVIAEIEQRYGLRVRGVFLNWYKNGGDYCPYHADMYGTNVLTLSLGETRDLLIKRNGPGKANKLTLSSGDLYYMSAAMQHTHKHSIPKRKRANGDRISVVFFTT